MAFTNDAHPMLPTTPSQVINNSNPTVLFKHSGFDKDSEMRFIKGRLHWRFKDSFIWSPFYGPLATRSSLLRVYRRNKSNKPAIIAHILSEIYSQENMAEALVKLLAQIYDTQMHTVKDTDV